MGFMAAPPSGDGNFTVYVKFNAKAGRFYTKPDEQDAVEFEVQDLTAIFDMENLRTGWFLFAANQAPVKHYDPGLDQAAPQPEGKFKRGFELNLFSEKNLLGVREFCSTAGVVIEAMNDLYDAWEVGRQANVGKLPVVKCMGVLPVVGTHGTNYKPQFEIVAWADRPDGLAASTQAPNPTPTAAPAPAPAAQAHTPPPQPAPAPAPASGSAEVVF